MLRLSAGTNCARTDVHFYKLPPWCCNPISANVLSNVQFQTIFWIPNDYILRHSNSSSSEVCYKVITSHISTDIQSPRLFYSRLFPLDAQLCSLELVFWGQVCPRDNRWRDYSHSAPCLQSLCCTFADGIWLWVLTHLKWPEVLRTRSFFQKLQYVPPCAIFIWTKILSKRDSNCWRKSRMPRWVECWGERGEGTRTRSSQYIRYGSWIIFHFILGHNPISQQLARPITSIIRETMVKFYTKSYKKMLWAHFVNVTLLDIIRKMLATQHGNLIFHIWD